jgi:hypothetical protein
MMNQFGHYTTIPILSGIINPTCLLNAPYVYEFDVSDPSNNGYVLSFGTTVDVSDATIETTYVTRTNTPGIPDAKVLLDLRDYSGVSLVYFEDSSAGMGYYDAGMGYNINYAVTVSNEAYVLKQNGYQELDDAALDNTELDVSYQNVSSSYSYGSPYLDYKAFGEYTHDGKLWYENHSSWSTYQNTNTYYTNIDGVNVTGDWLQVDIESKKQIISFHIVRINDWDYVGQGQLKEFYVVGSNDNTTFTELGHYYGANIPALNSSPDFTSPDLVIPEYYSHIDSNTLDTNDILQRTSEIIHITTPGEYRYLRFVMHDVYTNAAVSNIRLFESPSQTKPQIDFSANNLYVFDQSDPTNAGQQIVFGYTPDNSANILTSADGVTVMGTPGQPGAYTQLDLSSVFVGPLYYYSDGSANMGYIPSIPVDVSYSFTVKPNVIGDNVWSVYDTSNAVWYNQPDLSFNAPYVYEFDVSDPSNNGYVFSFGTIVDVSDATIESTYVTRTNAPGTTDAKVLLDLRDYSGVSLVYFEDSSAGMGYVEQPTFPSSMNIEFLVVGGGGQGCYGYAGGGGAGGMVDSSASILSTGYSVNIEVGAGGSGQNSDTTTSGISGDDSVFGSSTAIGGGGGSRLNPESTAHAAKDGGSGGGGGPQRSDQTSYLQYVVGGQGTAGQGYAGGDGNVTTNNSNYDPEMRAGGGGGGAGGTGVGGGSTSGTAATITSGYGGAGGAAKQWSIDGNYYAAGGGGATRIDGSPSNEQGGSGGGYTDANGDFVMLGGHGAPTTSGGSSYDGTSGVANTGSGGGGGWEYDNTEATGANGVVKVWVPVSYTYSSSHVSNVTNNIGGSSSALTYNGTDGTLISFIGAGTATWSPGWVGTNVVSVTVSNEVFYLDGSANPQIDFSANESYFFDQSDPTNAGQQIVFGYNPDSTTNILTSADGVTIMGTPGQPGAYTQLDLSSGFTGILYYYSDGSANMGYAPSTFGMITNSGGYAVQIDNVSTNLIAGVDFTIEFFVNISSSSSGVIFGANASQWYEDMLIYYYASSGDMLVRYYWNGGDGISMVYTGPIISLNQWHHFAVVRHNDSASLYIDGVKKDHNSNDSSKHTMTNSTQALDSTLYLFKFWDSNYTGIIGSMASIRISKKAVYIGNFTAPSPELSTTQSSGTNIQSLVSSDVVLLVKADPQGNNNVVNDSQYSVTITEDAGITTTLGQEL